jgi:hypothetical protein
VRYHLRRRGDERIGAEIGKPRLDPGIGQAGIDLAVELFDDRRRRALRDADAEPGGESTRSSCSFSLRCFPDAGSGPTVFLALPTQRVWRADWLNGDPDEVR